MKQTRKQIKAELINDLSVQYKKSYESRIKRLEDNLHVSMERCDKLQKKNFELVNRNDELEQKVIQYEDWINRLQTWCNLPDDERENAIKQYKVQQDGAKKLNKLMDMFYPYMNIFY